MLAERGKISRPNLLAGQSSFDRRQFQDHAEHSRQGSVTPKNLIVENQVLQFAPLDCHQNNFVRRVNRSNNATGARLYGQGPDFTVTGTDAAAKAELFVDNRPLAAEAIIGLRLQSDNFNRAHHQAKATTAAIGLHPGQIVAGVHRVFMAEALGDQHRLTATGTTVANEVIFIDVLAIS